jgi:hypothetical protein
MPHTITLQHSNHSTQSRPPRNRNQNQSLSLMREKLNRQHKPGLSSNNIGSYQVCCRTDSHDEETAGILGENFCSSWLKHGVNFSSTRERKTDQDGTNGLAGGSNDEIASTEDRQAHTLAGAAQNHGAREKEESNDRSLSTAEQETATRESSSRTAAARKPSAPKKTQELGRRRTFGSSRP